MAGQITLDYTKISIIKKIKKIILENHNYNIDEEDIAAIIRCQAVCLADGIKTGQDVKLDYLGKFLIKEGREMALETSRVADEMGLQGEERERFQEEARKAYVIEKITRKKKKKEEFHPRFDKIEVAGIMIDSRRERNITE